MIVNFTEEELASIAAKSVTFTNANIVAFKLVNSTPDIAKALYEELKYMLRGDTDGI